MCMLACKPRGRVRLPCMTSALLVRAALVATLVGASACATALRPAASMDATACGAIAAAIDSLVVGSRATRVGLRERTSPKRDDHALALLANASSTLPALDGTTLRSFRENNARALPACETLPLVGGVTRLPERELDRLPRGDGYWSALHARFPGVDGVTTTSGVGVGKDGRQALLVVDHACGGLCGAGHLVLLERDDDGKWRVKRAWMTWIS